LRAGIARLRAELHRFISGGIEEFLGFALFAKQNADFLGFMAARCGPPFFFAVVFFAERALYRRLEGGVLYREKWSKFFVPKSSAL